MKAKYEQPEKIIKTLFTETYQVREVTESGKMIIKNAFLKNVGEMYLVHCLEKNWQEICGEHLAKYCCVQRLNGSELFVSVANSVLANELFMMKSLFLQKVNAQLMGKRTIKKVSFQVSSNIKKYEGVPERLQDHEEEEKLPKKYQQPCKKCGVIVQSDNSLCDVCAREEKNLLKSKIAELLKVQPWLQYDECLHYYQCDRILFTAVKDGLKNIYFEKVRLNTANEYDCQMAVMFLTGKSPEEIDEKIYENSLAYLRRKQSVLTSRLRLHGKK